MAREQMLLDRIASGGARRRVGREASATEDVEAVMDSVRRQLSRILNARHGLSEALPDYGLPALTDLTAGGGNHVRLVQDAIRVAVTKYEPRLHHVRVSPVTDDDGEKMHCLSFRVDAVLVCESGEHRVCYETMMSGSGQFDVSD